MEVFTSTYLFFLTHRQNLVKGPQCERFIYIYNEVKTQEDGFSRFVVLLHLYVDREARLGEEYGS